MHVSEAQLAAVAKEVLETMAFTFEMPGEEAPESTDLLRATVGFRGPFGGAVSLALPRSMMPDIVVNMLGVGEDEIPPEQDQRDAIGELANVICGNLVQVLAGPQPIFDLAPPKIDIPPLHADAKKGAVTSTRIPLENGWAEVSLILHTNEVQAPVASNPAARTLDGR